MMDSLQCERKLEKIIALVTNEISDDIVETIFKGQQKYNFRHASEPNAAVNGSTAASQYGTKNVATMTENSITDTTGATLTDNNLTKKPADKTASKKRTAEERKELQIANKMYKPGECMKHMVVEMHPALSSAWYAADVSREVSATTARVRTSPALCNPALVLWSRGVPPTLAAESGLVQLSSTREQCDRALYVTTAEELSEMVAARDLARQMGNVAQLAGCKITLVAFGVQDYFKPSGRKKSNNHRSQMTEVELEMALTDLLVTAGCDTVKVDTPNELALTIVHFTKAIAEAPYKNAKRQCDEQAQFYMRGDNKNCVVVNKNGVGASKLWQQMLAILPMSSLERSRALCAQFSSPLRLFEELQSPGGVERVADIGVTRSAVPGSLARRNGVEFARKLAIIFTAEDGETLVQ